VTSDGLKLQCIAIATFSSFLMFTETYCRLYSRGTFMSPTRLYDWQRSDTRVSTAFCLHSVPAGWNRQTGGQFFSRQGRASASQGPSLSVVILAIDNVGRHCRSARRTDNRPTSSPKNGMACRRTSDADRVSASAPYGPSLSADMMGRVWRGPYR